jgi:hypothetical protein
LKFPFAIITLKPLFSSSFLPFLPPFLPPFTLSLSLFIFFGATGVWTQGLMLTIWAISQLFFVLGIFFFYYHIIIVLGVHYYIYKSTYNTS